MKMNTFYRLVFSFTLVALVCQANAQQLALSTGHQHDHNHDHDHDHKHDKGDDIAFVKNAGQWNDKVWYKAPLGDLNTLFLENDGFTYLFHDEEDSRSLHDNIHKTARGEAIYIKAHAYKVKFLNASLIPLRGQEPRKEYHNYFIGDNQNKWQGNVPLFNKVIYPEIYQGIRLEAYDSDAHFKYDFIVSPNADPNQIVMDYQGVDQLEIDNSNLIVHLSVDDIIEAKPYAYQLYDGQHRQVACEYVLKDMQVSFEFPNGYDLTRDLIIDPTVVAATLSGTAVNKNFGHTATYDNAGNIYVGARSFGVGYPVTTGAFQQNYGGGGTDIAVSKYNTTGTTLIYASFIGGNDDDYPHSIVTDFDQQLYIYGTSNSPNYPTTNNAFQTSYADSTDIVITVLNQNGSGLVGSTYIGGSNIDGNNTSILNENYGDYYRGEIIIDQQRNVYIASVTSSFNFPVSNNAFDQTFNDIGVGDPAQDGVVFKLNSDLSTLFWSTFLGDRNSDTAMGLRLDDFNNVYVTGGAGSPFFPITQNSLRPLYHGGREDAYVVKISNTGEELLVGTFWGTNGDDHAFFIDVDEDNQVHIYGQTTGFMEITPNTYFSNIGSKQFLASFSSNLDQLVYSTVIGTGPNADGGLYSNFDFVPVAFMVDKCNNIYFSGYGAVGSLPTTSNRISNVANTFYLGVLDPNASALSYGTYYGNADHVDGGTSRFDKSGTVYQGVCSCTNAVMNTRPDAWASSQNTQCDIGVFKIDFDVATVTAAATALPATSGCAPFTVDLRYTGKDATNFSWDFGNGQTSSLENPSVTYLDAGTYDVLFVASNNATCNEVDSFFMRIDVLDGSSNREDTIICTESPNYFINATTTNATYEWNDGSTSATKNINSTGTYWVETSIIGCSRRDSFVVQFSSPLSLDLGPDFSICDAVSGPLDGTSPGIAYYEWDDGSNDPIRTINTPGQYHIFAIDDNGCSDRDTVNIQFGNTPFVDLGVNDTLCFGDTRTLVATTPNVDYLWQDGSTSPNFLVTQPGTYTVEISNNGCPFVDEINIEYTEFDIEVDKADVLCFGDCNGSIDLGISGNTAPYSYLWENGNTTTELTELCPGSYTVSVTDILGCIYEETIVIGEPELLDFEMSIIDVLCAGDQDGEIEITDVSGGTGPFLYTLDDQPYQNNNIFDRLNGGDFIVYVQDANGCTASQMVNIYEPPSVEVYAGEDQTIELGTSTTLEGTVTPFFNQLIEWTPGDSLGCNTCLTTLAAPTSTTLYNLVVTDTISGCVLTDDVLIRVDKTRKIYIPNAFSPNQDGENDDFYVFAGNGVRIIRSLKVFDRWGEFVFEQLNFDPNIAKHGWDGKFKGEEMNPGVFVYLVEVEFVDNEVILYKGDVTLLK